MTIEGELCWTPSPERVAATRMTDFMSWLEKNRGLRFADYEALWRWSVDDVPAFWAALWDYLEIISDKPYARVMSDGGMMATRWFEGAGVNYAEHILRREANAAPGEVALHHGTEIRPFTAMSWRELGDQVRAVATQFRALGVRPGDRVVSYMPNVPETAIAMLAATAIGAVWSAAAPEFGVKTVVDRFSQITPKILLAADGYSFGGKQFDRRNEVRGIVEDLPTLERVIFLPYLGLDAPADLKCPLTPWSELASGPAPSREAFKFERVPSDHPLWVLFSSGTTGLPKAITHSHAGIVLDQCKQMMLHFDLKPGRSMFFYTTTGWMMWNAVLSALFAGASAVLYDGSPTWPHFGKLWEIAEETGASTFGASPTLVGLMEANNVRPGESFDVSRIDAIVLGGAPATAGTFDWLYNNVKKDLWVINTSGGTDLCGGLVGPTPIKPVYAAEMQTKMLGIAVEAWDESGKPLIGEVGELVVTRPFPSQPLYFWGDKNNERYHDTYFSTYPGVWRHGDFIKINAHGGCCIYGRADATLNRFGVRIGTSEIYGVVDRLDRVADSIVVCCETADGGFFMPLFVKLKDGDALDESLIETIKRELRTQTSPRHLPDIILQAPKIPYTLTGKKMEVPLRKVLMGAAAAQVSTPDAMSDPASLDWYADYAAKPDIQARFARRA